MRLINEALGDCHCLHLRDRPATTSLPSEESGSQRDRSELATAIHAPREKQRNTRMEASHCHEHPSPSRCCSSFVEKESARTGCVTHSSNLVVAPNGLQGCPFRRAFV